MHARQAVVLASLVFPLVGCLPEMPTGGAAAPAPDAGAAAADTAVDQSAVLAGIAHGEYHYNPQFVPVNRDAYPSAVAMTTRINVWVTSADAADYLRITPDAHDSGATVRPGTMLVREVLDASGQVAKLTLMVKGPPGYNPAVGDFWFGVTQPDGTPVVADGMEQMGKLDQCYSCHQTRAGDGFLFGVPAAHRMLPGAGGTVPPADAGTSAPDGGATTDGGTTMDAGSTDGSTDLSMPPDVCGDFICGATESCSSCGSDCHCCGGGDTHGHTHPCN